MSEIKNEPALVVRDVTIELDGHTIIDRVSFSCDTGTTTAIIGPNGAGKSILLKGIIGLLPLTAGSVHIFGRPHHPYRRVAPLVSYIPQRLHFNRHLPLTVRGLFALKSPRPLGLSRSERQRMTELLNLINVADLIDRQLRVLSGGQLQRVLLAYSLMDYPKLLLLDEPAAGIDTQGQETIYPLLSRIQKEEKLTLIIISHELEIVMNFAQQALCLNKKLLCAGVPQQVLTNETLQQMYGAPVRHVVHQHEA